MNFSQSFFDQKKNSGPKKNFSSYFQTSKTGNESDWIPQTPPSNFTMKGFERKPQQRQQQNQESSLINCNWFNQFSFFMNIMENRSRKRINPQWVFSYWKRKKKSNYDPIWWWNWKRKV